MFRQIGPMEIFIILGVVLLLFGGRKLPELARGSGRALRIFKSEVQDLHDDKDGENAGKSSSAARTDDLATDPDALDPAPSSTAGSQAQARDARPEQL